MLPDLMISPRIEEYSRVWPSAQFIPARKLTQKLAAQLNKPIKFEYSHGRVGNIYAQPELSENILNIYRGILNMLQISIKKSQNIYELQENGVEGICHASYVIQENKKSGVVMVTKSKDLNNCQEKISETKGSAYTQLCETCQQTLGFKSKISILLLHSEGGLDAQWLLLPHRARVLGLISALRDCVEFAHSPFVSAWVSSGYSGFLPYSKDVQVSLTKTMDNG
eukprot:g43207.t1